MLVSVIMPSYNHSKYVLEAAHSVLGQTYKRIEFIVIDDGSTDDSLSLLKAIDDPRMTLLEQSNAGAHASINRGLELAQGDYISIINSDDIYFIDRVEKCLRFIDAHSLDMVCSWISVIDGMGKDKGIKRGWENMRPAWSMKEDKHGFWESDDFVLNLLATNFVSTTTNMFFRRTVFDSVGGMRNLRFAHDWDFMLRVAECFKCGLIPEPLMKYRVHGSNTINTNKGWMLFEVLWVLAANLRAYEGTKIFGDLCSPEELVEQMHKMMDSIHFEGLDRVFWLLRTYLNSRRRVLGEQADEELLDSSRLRQVFIDQINIALTER